MPAAEVPQLVKHSTIAIWRDGGITGGRRARFVSAWNISRSRLVEYGFLSKGSEHGKARDIKLTAKGQVRNRQHARESDSKAKSALFDEMFRWIETAEDVKNAQDKSPGATKAATKQDRGDVAKIKQETSTVASRLEERTRLANRKGSAQQRKAPKPKKPTKPTSFWDTKRPK
jgi:hypothetical protein